MALPRSPGASDDKPVLAPGEQTLLDAVAARRDDLVVLAASLVAFDTTAGPGFREEAALQQFLAQRLAAAGAQVDVWEPDAAVVAGSSQVPPGHDFTGRPQLVARFPGRGGGRTLLFNGHIDVVSAEPVAAWTTPPFQPTVRDGRLYGRGACDMKGGVAAMVIAAEAVADRLDGDLVLCTVTDEEETGAGALAVVAKGIAADAGLVAEPSAFDIWVAVRGDVVARVTVEGRLGHAGLEHAAPHDGGAVNAIERMRVLLDAVAGLHASYQERADHRHPHLSPGHAICTQISGGDWAVNIPARCEATLHVAYLPAHDGASVRAEVEVHLLDAAATDPWLRAHPPRIEWLVDIPACEVDASEPVVALAQAAARDAGVPGVVTGLDSWHDGATFARAGIPTVALGPPEIANGHTVDESVAIDDLVACAQAYALAALRFCNTSST